MDKLHNSFMKERMDELSKKDVDVSKYKLLSKVHIISKNGNGISCKFPRCQFRAIFLLEIDATVKKPVIRLSLKSLTNQHSGPFH